MNTVNLEFPILVQPFRSGSQTNFRVRPFFKDFPMVEQRRYEEAVEQFRREVRQHWKGYELHEGSKTDLMWSFFNPKISYKTAEFAFQVGQQHVKGRFGYGYFELKGKTFVTLPAFDNFMFLLETEGGKVSKGRIKMQVESVVKDWLRLRRKEEKGGNTLDWSGLYAEKGEFVTVVKVGVSIQSVGFPFEQEQGSQFLAHFFESENFNGGIELGKVGQNLNELYPSALHRAFYREELTERLSAAVYGGSNTPVVLIGKVGAGKHTLLHEVIYRYLDRNRHIESEEILTQCWYLNPNRVIAGMSIVGMWQKRFEAILKYLQNRVRNGDKLVIDNPIALLRVGRSAQNKMVLSDVLKPYLEKRQVQCVLIATPETWKIVQERARSFADLFLTIRVEEPSLEEAIKMTLKKRQILENQFDVEITIDALRQVFDFQRVYLKKEALPGGAVKMLEQLVIKQQGGYIDAEVVRQNFQNSSGLLATIFSENYTFQKNELQEGIAAELIGQPAAVEALANALHLIKAKLNNPNRPLASFLFIGPTGVGKTQAAKVLARQLTGSEETLLRFDMNEYIDSSAVQRLIGGYNNPEGQLTSKAQQRPFGILLLDEIEKAHPKVHDLLLQLLDDGRLTDSLGRTTDFTNLVIVMTSNVGAREVGNRLGFNLNYQQDDQVYWKALRQQFRPEFINRIDKVLIFNNLSKEHIFGIARLQINELLQRDGFVRRMTLLNVSEEALEWVAEQGYNERMGGRALKRQIEKDLTALLAQQLVKMYVDKPVIFEIYFENKRLVPKILPLEFLEPLEDDWMPTLPSERQIKGFYRHLVKVVEQLQDNILNLEEIEREALVVVDAAEMRKTWQVFAFREHLFVLKEQLTEMVIGFKDNRQIAPAIPFRLKRVGAAFRSSGGFKKIWIREKYQLQDRFFQEVALNELQEGYRYGSYEFDRANTEYLDFFLETAFAQLFMEGYRTQKTDVLTLQLTALVQQQGEASLKYLFKLYENLLKDMNFEFHPNEDELKIKVEGYNARLFFRGECGIHLFYIAHQSPIPIKFEIVGEPCELKVIRLYDRSVTLTDLRSGYTNDINISANELKFLIFAGLPPHFQKL